MVLGEKTFFLLHHGSNARVMLFIYDLRTRRSLFFEFSWSCDPGQRYMSIRELLFSDTDATTADTAGSVNHGTLPKSGATSLIKRLGPRLNNPCLGQTPSIISSSWATRSAAVRARSAKSLSLPLPAQSVRRDSDRSYQASRPNDGFSRPVINSGDPKSLYDRAEIQRGKRLDIAHNT